MEELLFYIFFRLPGIIVLSILSGFKYKFLKEEGNKKEYLISGIFWASIILFLIIKNN